MLCAGLNFELMPRQNALSRQADFSAVAKTNEALHFHVRFFHKILDTLKCHSLKQKILSTPGQNC